VGPRICVSMGLPQHGHVRYEPGMRVQFRWWAEPAVGAVTLQVWDQDRDRNYMLELGTADGTWQQASIPFTRLQAYPGVPQPELRPQAGDRLLGVLLIGSAPAGRLYLDDVGFSAPE
jgi:hypothetical protein